MEDMNVESEENGMMMHHLPSAPPSSSSTNEERRHQHKLNKKASKKKPSLTLPLNNKKPKKAVRPRAPPSDNNSHSSSQNSAEGSSIDDEEEPQVTVHEMSDYVEDDDDEEAADDGDYVIRPVVEMPDQSVYDTLLQAGLKPNDDEHFTLDDNIVRPIIYKDARKFLTGQNRQKINRVITINFTRQHFEKGATKWYHLKEHYYELLMSILNSLAFATGKKVKLTPAEKVVREKPQANKNKRRRGVDDDDDEDPVAMAANIEKTPEIELNNFLQGNKDINVAIETLVTGNKVSGFRWWITDRTAAKIPNDILSLGLRESLLEAARIQEQANKQMQAIIKSNGSAKSAKAKKATAAKQYALSKEFSFSNYSTFDRHLTGLVKRYFGKDSCLAVSDNLQTNGKAATRRQFKDTRPYTTYDTVQQDGNHPDYTHEKHPCNFSSLFDQGQAMFYYVNEENINEDQCRLESYFENATGGLISNANNSAHSKINLAHQKGLFPPQQHAQKKNNNNGAPEVADVANFTTASEANQFKKFPHPSLVYELPNTFLSHEFMSRMPLPHRLGSTLYTQKDVISLKRKAGLPISPTEEAEAETELVKERDLEEFLEGLVFSENSEDEHNIFGDNNTKKQSKSTQVSYGAVVRFMGIHQTEMELTTDVLLSQLHHVDALAQPFLKQATVPRDIIDKFLSNKRNEINARLKLILSNLGPKNRTVVTETLAASINGAQGAESIGRKSLSSSLFSSAAGSDGRDQTASIMDQIGHNNHVDEKDTNLLQLPYVSMTQARLINNSSKTIQLQRKACEYIRRQSTGEDEDENGLALDPEARAAQLKHIDNEYQSKLASGKVAFYKDTIEKYRPFGNSLYALKTQLHNTDVEEVFLGRDIFLRLAELNAIAYANLDLAFFDHESGILKKENEDAYYIARRELRDALAVECWHEFFENRSVSLACEGIRSDLLKQKIAYAPPETASGYCADDMTNQRMIGTPLSVHVSRQELRPYGEYRTWVQGLFADQFGIAYNFKIMWILYIGRLHHCRWHPDCNSPKHNILLSGTGMAGKSHMLQAIKKILPTGVGDMVTHITDQAFNVDRNMNDMLLIYEEFQNKFLGYSGGGGKNSTDGNGGGGMSAGSDKDTTNFFKARLTSGATSTFSWYENEETGMRDMKISKAHCQGNIMGASNNDFTSADPNVMSRFILLSVAKSKTQHEGNRPQDKQKFVFGIDSPQDKAIYEQHKELHRVYFMMEQMIKSGVLGENVFGVNVDGGRIMRDLILDHLQKRYGLATGDVRKREHILELARSMALSYAVWMGLTSPLTRHLQYDPHDPEKFIGFNPRVITEGILPFCVITKDMIFDAITSLSSLWYHDYQELILEVFATKMCKLQELREEDFLTRSKQDNFFMNLNNNNPNAKRSGTSSLTTSRNNIPAHNSSIGNAYGGVGGGNPMDEKETDYNYIVITGKDTPTIFQQISGSTGDLVVSQNDICKYFNDNTRNVVENCEGYRMNEVADGVDELTGAVLNYKRTLVKSGIKDTRARPIVEIGRYPNGKFYVAVLVHFIKQKLPGLFGDDIIHDLSKSKNRFVTPDELNPVAPDEQALGEMDVEANESAFEAKVRRIGKIGPDEETLIIKSIKDIMENSVLEDIGLDEEERRELEESYSNPHTGQVPWYSYMMADPPKPMYITDFYPELKEKLEKTDDGDAPILFVDQMKMLELKPRKNGRKIVIRNHNTVNPSTRVTLSIYKDRQKQLVKRVREDGTTVTELGPGEVLKKARIDEYSKTEAWELDLDIDAIFCEEHLRNIAFGGLKSKPDYSLINYPPCTYMAIMEDKSKEEGLEGVLVEYPMACNMVRIAQRKRHAEGLIDPTTVKYKKLGVFMRSNQQNGATQSNRTRSIGKPIPRRNKAAERASRNALVETLFS